LRRTALADFWLHRPSRSGVPYVLQIILRTYMDLLALLWTNCDCTLLLSTYGCHHTCNTSYKKGKMIISKNHLAFGKRIRLFWFKKLNQFLHPRETIHPENPKFRFSFPNALLLPIYLFVIYRPSQSMGPRSMSIASPSNQLCCILQRSRSRRRGY
jgi:hypothetical protein